eukprot:3915741-Prorocentrum_lima.AAC.1
MRGEGVGAWPLTDQLVCYRPADLQKTSRGGWGNSGGNRGSRMGFGWVRTGWVGMGAFIHLQPLGRL